MKKPMTLLLLMVCLPVQAGDSAQASLQEMRFAQTAGAPALALRHLDQAEIPAGEKEAWRIMLLSEAGRHGDALAAAEAFRISAPERAPRQAWLSGLRSALALGEGKRALALAERLLWQAELTPQDYREARSLVVDAILASGRGDDAYRAMLRYQQDFPPLSRGDAVRFTEGLIATGLDVEAVTWLADLDRASPLRLLARMKAGLLAPADAIAEARQILDPPSSPAPAKGRKAKPSQAPRPEDERPYWAILMHAGVAAGEFRIAADAMERLLGGRTVPAGIWGVKPEALWEVYGVIARQEANAAQLLDGDERAWFELALSLASSRPLAARALFGHLADAAQDDKVRETAWGDWLRLMVAQHLEHAALRLMSHREGGDESGLALAADMVLKAMPADELPRRREAWLVIGDLAVTRNLHAYGALAFLRAAEGGDALAQEARWRAAESLARAGLGQDALAVLKARPR